MRATKQRKDKSLTLGAMEVDWNAKQSGSVLECCAQPGMELSNQLKTTRPLAKGVHRFDFKSCPQQSQIFLSLILPGLRTFHYPFPPHPFDIFTSGPKTLIIEELPIAFQSTRPSHSFYIYIFKRSNHAPLHHHRHPSQPLPPLRSGSGPTHHHYNDWRMHCKHNPPLPLSPFEPTTNHKSNTHLQSGCTAHSTPMPTMNSTAVPYPAGNGTTVHISNCPSAYSTGPGGMMTPIPAPGAETTPVPCDGTSCADTSAGMMPTDSGMGMPSSDAGPSMGMEGGV